MQELKVDSDDQGSVCSEKSVSVKSLTSYDDTESSTCDSIITDFKSISVNAKNFGKMSPVNEEVEFTNEAVAEIPTKQISSECQLNESMESIVTPLCNNKEENKTRENSTNTENYRYKRKLFRQANNRYYKYRPYGYNHKHFNYQPNNYYRSNYYQRSFYNRGQQKQYYYMNRYQYNKFCNNWDCEIRHRQNEHFKNMLFRGIFHFTKFLEFISQIHF